METEEENEKRKISVFIAKCHLKTYFPLFIACFYSPFTKSGFESFPGALLESKWSKHPGKEDCGHGMLTSYEITALFSAISQRALTSHQEVSTETV